MKKACLMLAVLFVFLMLPAMMPAQTFYEVWPGDTLWEIAGVKLDDPRQWRVIVEKNPFLQEPGRIFERGGKIIALIRPGEKLLGLEELGILPKVLPFAALDVSATSQGFWSNLVSGPLLFWLLLAVLVVLAILGFMAGYRVIAQRMKYVNPTAAGPAFVEPTIRRTPELIAGRFAGMAAEAAARRDPMGTYVGARPERIGPIESGYLTGHGRVSYADGSLRELTLNRERAYRARYRMPDGAEEVLYSIAGCMNPVALFRGERFAWSTEEVAVSAPAPAPTEPAPAPLRVVSESPGPTVVAVGDLELAVPHGSTVSVNGQGQISVVPTTGTILVNRKAKTKRQPPKVVRPAATATDRS